MDPSQRQPLDADPESKFDRPTGSGPRQILDITIQSCMVELFHALGVAIAPLGASRAAPLREHFDLVGIVAFSEPRANGTLMLSLEDGVYQLLPSPAENDRAKHDALRELTNQLIGRIKNRLLQFQLTLRIGLPSAMRRQMIGRQLGASPPLAAYVFRTLRGEVVVSVNGQIDEGSLNYSSRVRVAKEGDLITF